MQHLVSFRNSVMWMYLLAPNKLKMSSFTWVSFFYFSFLLPEHCTENGMLKDKPSLLKIKRERQAFPSSPALDFMIKECVFVEVASVMINIFTGSVNLNKC